MSDITDAQGIIEEYTCRQFDWSNAPAEVRFAVMVVIGAGFITPQAKALLHPWRLPPRDGEEVTA
jgi:hypothetical protein